MPTRAGSASVDRWLGRAVYVVHLAGIGAAAGAVGGLLGLEGETEAGTATSDPGRMELELPLVVEWRFAIPVLVIRHPTWSPQAALSTSDPRHPHLLLRLRVDRAGPELIRERARRQHLLEDHLAVAGGVEVLEQGGGE